MEGPSFEGMPKFKNSEEELDYLRAHVAKREAELVQKGHTENAQENAVHDVVGEYKNIPAEQVVHPSHILNEKETAGIVLQLKPEPHDNIMEELLGIVMQKGIRNALSVVAAMDNPHVEDDFHRFLVQYFKAGQSALSVKEGTPLYKSLNMTLMN